MAEVQVIYKKGKSFIEAIVNDGVTKYGKKPIAEVIEETGWGIKVLKKEGIFQRFTYMPEYKIWAHKICHIYRCAATMRKTEHLEKNHRSVIMNKKKALEKVVDTGFKYFIQNS